MRFLNQLKHNPFKYSSLFMIILLILCSCTMGKPSQATEPANANQVQNGISNEAATITESLSETVPKINLTGVHSVEVMDNDKNGLYEALAAEVEVFSDSDGTTPFEAFLLSSDGSIIDRGNLIPDSQIQMATEITQRYLQQGVQKLRFYFNGRTIRGSKTDGPYSIHVQVLGTSNEETSLEISTKPYRADEFQGLLAENHSITEYRGDTDHDGLYNELVIQVEMDVLARGDFFTTGSLFAGDTAAGHKVVEKTLKKGRNTVRLAFDGRALRSLETDGSYQVYITIDDGFYSENIAYETKACLYSEFQQTEAFFTGDITDSPVDSDGDGQYDALNIHAQVQADVWGLYEVQCILEGEDGAFLGTSEKKVNLKGKPTEVVLEFDGLRIYRSGVNGPYKATLVILDLSGQEVAGKLYQTWPYERASFQHPKAEINEVISSTPIDLNADGVYDHLRFHMEAEAVQAGVYKVESTLYSYGQGQWVTSVEKEFNLVEGKNTLALDFDGEEIHNSGIDGPYKVQIALYDSHGEWVSNLPGVYKTDFYACKAFQPSDVFTTGTFSCHGEDSDQNSLYEYLVASVELSVLKEGVYDFQAGLADSEGKEIVCSYEHATLQAGIQTITFRFNGQFIYDSQTDGPYTIKDLYIYCREDEAGTEFTDVFLTQLWRWNEFQQIGRYDKTSGPP